MNKQALIQEIVESYCNDDLSDFDTDELQELCVDLLNDKIEFVKKKWKVK